MRPTTQLLAGLLLCALIAASGLHLYRLKTTACSNDKVLDRVLDTLRVRDGLDQTMINDVETVAGGPFASAYACTAQVAVVRGNIPAEKLTWHQVRFSSGPDGVSVALGDVVPLAAPEKTRWARLLEHFGLGG